MGLFDIFKNKKLKKKKSKTKMTPQEIADSVSAIKKIRDAKNDNDFIKGMMDLPSKKKRN